jgi:hypothetical protein
VHPEEGESDACVPVTAPHRRLFDGIACAVQDDPDGGYARLGRLFDPRLSPEEHLPGGSMNMARHSGILSTTSGAR